MTSTDRKPKKKRSFLFSERMKIIEYGCIGLVVLLFAGLAIYYGLSHKADAPATDAQATASPEPTADPTIRGMNVLDALESAGFTVAMQDDRYLLTAPNEVPFTMEMTSDDRGVKALSFETYLCPDPTDDSAVSAGIRAENELSVAALRALFDAVMPVFHRTVADSETIVTQCVSVVKKGTSYAKKLGGYSVRILTDPDALVQSVTVTLSRDS